MDSGKNLHSTIVTLKDDMKMVLIPGGTYVIGSNNGHSDEKPVHEVTVDPFYMDEHEVTVRQYGKFIKATSYPAPLYWNPDIDGQDDPVVGVSWFDAMAYAEWAGKRLPTEVEWEIATAGNKKNTAVVCDQEHANTGSFGILSVKSLKPNEFGLYDMVGNVWEWCSDWYDRDYYSFSPSHNPKGPNTGMYKVLRGGAWYQIRDKLLVTERFYALPGSKSFNNGFRCVRPVE